MAQTDEPNLVHGAQDAAALATSAAQLPNFVEDPEFVTIYTNWVQSVYSPFDVALFLGEATGPTEGGRATIKRKAKIIMAVAEAKIVATILAGTVAKYEAQYGKIVLAPELFPKDDGGR
jgi:hypothetical protein